MFQAGWPAGIGPAGAVMTLILIGVGSGGCSLSRTDGAFARMDVNEITGSLVTQTGGPAPTESDLAFARNAASDVLTRGGKDFSQPWENPETGARGSVTPIAAAYTAEGRTCRDFLLHRQPALLFASRDQRVAQFLSLVTKLQGGEMLAARIDESAGQNQPASQQQ